MKNKNIYWVVLILLAASSQDKVNAAVRNPFVSQLPLAPEPPADKKETIKAPSNQKSPSVPIVLEEKDLPVLKVTGLVWNSKRPQAIINGQVVSVGETIGEVKIVSIRPDGVDVLFQDKVITITP